MHVEPATSSPEHYESRIESALWEQLIQAVQQHQRFMLTTHVKPDGDGVGSQIALARFLQQQGKTVHIVNDAPLHPSFQFLDSGDLVQSFEQAEKELQESPPEVIFIIDISSTSRLGAVQKYVENSSAMTICLDHHHPSGDEQSDLSLVDVEAAASGEIVFQFIHRWPGTKLTPEVAEPLYVSVLTDTGCFAHTNASAQIHRIAAALLDTGISHTQIYRCLFQSGSLARYKFLAYLMNELQTSEEGNLAWSVVTQENMQAYGMSPDEMGYFAESPRMIGSVEVILFFVEGPNGDVKLSLRSKGRANVLEIAQEIGGGGHQHASGAKVRGSLQEVLHKVVGIAKEKLAEQLQCSVTLPEGF